MAEEVVEGLESVQIEEESRDRAGTARLQPLLHMFQQCAAVCQTGQVIVQGDETELLLGFHPGLQLREQGGDRFEHVQLPGTPVAVADFDETEQAGRPAAGYQRYRRGADVAEPGRGMDGLLVVGGAGRDEEWFGGVLERFENRIRLIEIYDLERIRFGHVLARWPLGHQHRGSVLGIVVPQVAEVDVEIVDQHGQHLLGRRHHGRRVDAHQLRGDFGHQRVECPPRHLISDHNYLRLSAPGAGRRRLRTLAAAA